MKRRQNILFLLLFLSLALTVGAVFLLSKSPGRAPPVQTQQNHTSRDEAINHAPLFSAESGFYSEPFSLSISCAPGCRVYYTLDGSVPDSTDSLYSAPLEITDRSNQPNNVSAIREISPPLALNPTFPVDKATILKAVAVDPDGNSSPVSTATYFIGFDKKAEYYRSFKIVSLTTEPDNLFNQRDGIYMLGEVYRNWKNSAQYNKETPSWETPANYMETGRAWERPATIEIFEDQALVWSGDVGIRIHGGATRSYPQKSFNVYARKIYGSARIDYDLFSGNNLSELDGSVISEYNSFMFRNTGNDSQYSRIRDKINQSLVSDRKFLTQEMEPCILFINGEYWGQYEITEKISNDLIEEHFGVNENNVVIIKNDNLEAGTEQDYSEFKSLWSWIRKTDLSIQDNYESLKERVDVESFADYVIAEMYINNWDWGSNNMAMWKTRICDGTNPFADGRWRFIMFDTEHSANLYGMSKPSVNAYDRLMAQYCFLKDLFAAATQNREFCSLLYQSFIEISGSNYAPGNVRNELARLSPLYHHAVLDTFYRFYPDWPGGKGADEHYYSEINAIQDFFDQRREFFARDLEPVFSILSS